MSEEQLDKLRANWEGFTRYCVGCEGDVPPEGSDDFNRLGNAFLAWSAKEVMR